MKKNNWIKILLWLFTLWISFSGILLWYYTPSCSNVWTQSTSWCSVYSNTPSWYCNNWNGINLYLSGNTNSQGYDSNNQLNLWNLYKDIYNSWKDNNEKIWTINYGTTWWIWSLQKLMWSPIDCKLWNNTINTFLTTNVCQKINSNRQVLTWNSCASGYQKTWNYCCEQIMCANPPQNWVCASWYVPENNCCVAQCDKPQDQKVCPDWEDRVEEKCKCVCNPERWCCGVKLNTVVPFIGDCIEMTNWNDTTQWVNQLNAFPYLMKWLTKILITAIMIFSIIIVIVAWFLMSTSVANEWNYKKGTELLKKVIICLILLWCSWLILKLINPNFFG